jgi:hypothetical protein
MVRLERKIVALQQVRPVLSLFAFEVIRVCVFCVFVTIFNNFQELEQRNRERSEEEKVVTQ